MGLSFPSFAKTYPIRKHLKDATIINRERAPLYSKLSDKRSWPLSYELITMENLAQIVTNHLDYRVQPYLEKGIRIFEDELIDMSQTPKFSATFLDNDFPKRKINVDINAIQKKWLALVRKKEFNQIYIQAVDLLDHGDLKETNQNCLSRHFVESVARSLLTMQGHREKAEIEGLDDPQEIIVAFLKLQIQTLSWAHSLDKRAYPIQSDNIPLFCQDVPPIPYK